MKKYRKLNMRIYLLLTLKTVKSLYSLNKICLRVFIYTFLKVAHLPIQKIMPRHLDSCCKKNPRESFKNKRKGNNNYFLHLKGEGMLHEGNSSLHLDSC